MLPTELIQGRLQADDRRFRRIRPRKLQAGPALLAHQGDLQPGDPVGHAVEQAFLGLLTPAWLAEQAADSVQRSPPSHTLHRA